MELYTETSKSIQELVTSPSNLFEIYTLNILLSFGYYTIVFLVPLYFCSQFGFSDSQAGFAFAGCGLSLGLSALFGSRAIAWIGWKKGLNLATFSVFSGFLMLSMSKNLNFSLFSVFGLVCCGIGVSWPALGIAIKRYSEQRNRSTSNSIMMMGNYLAAIIAGAYIDIVWNYFIDKNTIFEIIFSTAAGALGLSFCISLILKEGDMTDSLFLSTSSLVLNKKFFKFFCVIILVTTLHSICFEQLDATFPKYLIRTSGEKSHFGVFLSIHSANMLIGALAFTPLAYKLSSYTLILLGSCFGLAACWVLSLAPTNLNYICYVLLLSTGESILVPRTLDYTMKVAGAGEEGFYLALSNSPFYFGMILTGYMSGELFKRFCEEGKTEECGKLWETVTFLSAFVVGLLIICKPCLSQDETQAESEEIVK